MKKLFISLLIILFTFSFNAQVSAYFMTPEEIYGEPEDEYGDGYDDGYDEGYSIGYDDGYYEGVYESGGEIVYKTREVPVVERVVDNHTRYTELWVSALFLLGLCVVPMLVFRFAIIREPVDRKYAGIGVAVYSSFAFALTAYIMYRIDEILPCASLFILWAIIGKYIITYKKKSAVTDTLHF